VTISLDLPANSLGKLGGGVSAQFRDLETNEVVGPNETGELCLKCPGLFTEYFANPEVRFHFMFLTLER